MQHTARKHTDQCCRCVPLSLAYFLGTGGQPRPTCLVSEMHAMFSLKCSRVKAAQAIDLFLPVILECRSAIIIHDHMILSIAASIGTFDKYCGAAQRAVALDFPDHRRISDLSIDFFSICRFETNWALSTLCSACQTSKSSGNVSGISPPLSDYFQNWCQ